MACLIPLQVLQESNKYSVRLWSFAFKFQQHGKLLCYYVVFGCSISACSSTLLMFCGLKEIETSQMLESGIHQKPGPQVKQNSVENGVHGTSLQVILDPTLAVLVPDVVSINWLLSYL